MSDRYLRFIPADPQFVPARAAAELARERFAQLVPEADEVTAETADTVEFIDPGPENFESISCPRCGQLLEISWWKDRMSEAYETRFSNLALALPCCGGRSSLNDLADDWPAGFARFVLEAMNPDSPDLPEESMAELSKILGTPLRKIKARS